MNLFRSEEHIRNWRGFKPGTEAGINRPADIVALFSSAFFTRRLDPDYASRMHAYMEEFVGHLEQMDSFWHPADKA